LSAHLPDGTTAGSVGDFAVYSFNPTKILECGGGALLIRSQKLASVCAELSESDPLPPEIGEGRSRALGLSYRNLHHSLVGLLRARAIDNASSPFLKLQPAFRELYLRRMKDPVALANSWSQLPKVVEHRYRNAKKYEELLASGNWERMSQWQQSGVCWRYSLLVNFADNLVDFSEAVRRDGFHVSNLYWPVNDFFKPGDSCPNADRFARRIVNLWVDQTVDQQWAAKCAESLLRNSSQFVS
jgi:dTDP-4-amino-4,6-dideoxygalactose transaminase